MNRPIKSFLCADSYENLRKRIFFDFYLKIRIVKMYLMNFIGLQHHMWLYKIRNCFRNLDIRYIHPPTFKVKF